MGFIAGHACSFDHSEMPIIRLCSVEAVRIAGSAGEAWLELSCRVREKCRKACEKLFLVTVGSNSVGGCSTQQAGRWLLADPASIPPPLVQPGSETIGTKSHTGRSPDPARQLPPSSAPRRSTALAQPPNTPGAWAGAREIPPRVTRVPPSAPKFSRCGSRSFSVSAQGCTFKLVLGASECTYSPCSARQPGLGLLTARFMEL